jgi:hypothetical protein
MEVKKVVIIRNKMKTGSLKTTSIIKRLSKSRELAFYTPGACGHCLGVIRQLSSHVIVLRTVHCSTHIINGD